MLLWQNHQRPTSVVNSLQDTHLRRKGQVTRDIHRCTAVPGAVLRFAPAQTLKGGHIGQRPRDIARAGSAFLRGVASGTSLKPATLKVGGN